MPEGVGVLIGMTIAYVASFAGLLFAYINYKKRKKKKDE
jgi:hypothetical protein